MNCNCPPFSPFLWRTNPSELNTAKMIRNADISSQSTRKVNASRKAGIEPMALSPMSNKVLAHAQDPKAAYLQPTIGRKP